LLSEFNFKGQMTQGSQKSKTQDFFFPSVSQVLPIFREAFLA